MASPVMKINFVVVQCRTSFPPARLEDEACVDIRHLPSRFYRAERLVAITMGRVVSFGLGSGWVRNHRDYDAGSI
jgi:hypothetical protein